MLGSNSFAFAKDVTVSDGEMLQKEIQYAKEATNIKFEKDINITSLNVIKLNDKPIEIDGEKIDGENNKLINRKDSRFTFVDNSSLTLKNLNYVGENASIYVDKANNATISLENVDISGRTTFSMGQGPVLYLNNCNTILNNVSVSSSSVEFDKKILGGVIYINSANSKGIITDLINNKIKSKEIIQGGLIYNRRTKTPVGELNLSGKVNGNEIFANVNVSGGILNNEKSSIQSINWKEVNSNTIKATTSSVTGGFIQNKQGNIDNLHIDSFSHNKIESNSKVDGGLIYNESGTVNGTLYIGQIVDNTINATTEINGLITNIDGSINSIYIDSILDNNFSTYFLRGGIINIQGANVNDVTIGKINNNKITGNGKATSTGFVLYFKESPNDSKIPFKMGNLKVGQVSGNEVRTTNITSLLLRSALVPVKDETVISKNGNVVVDEISNNKLIATDCDDNARGGIIYNFLHSGVATVNTTVSLGDIDLKQVINNHLESVVSDSGAEISDVSRALSGRHASGAIIANSIQAGQGTAIIKSINGEYVGNSLVSKSKIMDASGGVISNSVDGKGNAFVGIGYTLDENNTIVSGGDAILGTYKNNYVYSTELSANGGVIANYIEKSIEKNDKVQIGNINASFDGNYVISDKDSAYGGAISNFYVKGISDENYKNAIIESINSTFENNFAETKSTESSKGAYGGAISNIGIIKVINNSIFRNNYAMSAGGSKAFGGAIYTGQDLTINANNKGLTEFTGNYVSVDGGATKNYEAIYVNGANKTLTLNAETKGTILMNDYVNGVAGYNVLLTGDSTGTIKLFDKADIKGGANVTVGENVIIDTADGAIQKFSEFKSLKSSESAKYNIDVDLSGVSGDKSDYVVGEIADGFTTKDSSSGFVTLDSLNFVADSIGDIEGKNLKIQILQNNDNKNNLQLALSDNLASYTSTAGSLAQVKTEESKDLTSTVNYKDSFGTITTIKNVYGTLGLDKTNTTNDSLKVQITKIDTVTTSTISDALVALTNCELKDSSGNVLDKTFNLFDEDSLGNKTPANYKVTDTLGTNYNKLSIVGAAKTESSGNLILSELDLDKKTSFVVKEGSTLNISDINLKGNETVITNNGGILNFSNNNIIDGKITGTTALNTGVLGITADNLDVTLINDGTLNLGSGVVAKKITGSGTTNIEGAVTNNAAISQGVKVSSSGNLIVGANIGDLTNNGNVVANASNLTGTVNNSGTLNLSGILDKTIGGSGITKISGDSLILANGASVKGTLDVNNQTLNVVATDTDSLFNNVNINSGTLNLINNNINNLSAASFKISGNVNLLLDADLKNATMDRLPSTTVATGMINVKGINLLSDSKTENVYIPFAYDSFKDKVQTSVNAVGKNVENSYQTTTFAPIFKYNVSYNPNNGYFLFSRGGGKSSSDFNPAVLSGAVNSQVGAYSAVNETFNYAFRHADYSFMPLPKRIRLMANKYAITEAQSMRYENDYSKTGGMWYQPYANFENVGLSNGPRVDVQSYGTLIGGDSEYQQLKKGWGTVITPYIGYNGTSQSYSGVSTVTNGGVLGITQTFYRGDFFTALTVNAGAATGETNTMYGRDNYTSLMAGVGSKTGYNFEFNNGKFIIQPSMLMAYTFVNTFNYTNAAGVKISSDPLHSIQLHPSVKFMGNVGKGWQPYASVGMVWNILNETKFMANDVRLPEMSIKPYVEYGVGLQKCWQDKFTGFLQAMIRNGGRNGVALTFGFKWAFGNEGKPIEKVQNKSENVVKASVVKPQRVENSLKNVIKSSTTSDQKVNNVPQNSVQMNNNVKSLSSRLNISTPQQLAQRANMFGSTSNSKMVMAKF